MTTRKRTTASTSPDAQCAGAEALAALSRAGAESFAALDAYQSVTSRIGNGATTAEFMAVRTRYRTALAALFRASNAIPGKGAGR